MKISALICLCLMMLAACAQHVLNGEGAPKWEIKTRTLAHAPDGSPDSRMDVGIGEWLELKVVPETLTNVEWLIEGDAVVSNHFGNPAILIMGGEAGKLSIAAKVHDKPHSMPPVSKKDISKEKWRHLQAQLLDLENLADKPSAFESNCDHIYNGMLLHKGLAEARSETLSRFTRLLNDISNLSHRAPHTNSWAHIQARVLEASAIRLGACLESTADRSSLEQDFWGLLKTCADALKCQHQQFQEARRKARTHAQNKKTTVASMPTESSRLLTAQRSSGMMIPQGPGAVASAFASRLPDLRYWLYVQVVNALPGTSANEKIKSLIKHGFDKEEVELLLNDLDCRLQE